MRRNQALGIPLLMECRPRAKPYPIDVTFSAVNRLSRYGAQNFGKEDVMKTESG
jgi:hypothetical protein